MAYFWVHSRAILLYLQKGKKTLSIWNPVILHAAIASKKQFSDDSSKYVIAPLKVQ